MALRKYKKKMARANSMSDSGPSKYGAQFKAKYKPTSKKPKLAYRRGKRVK